MSMFPCLHQMAATERLIEIPGVQESVSPCALPAAMVARGACTAGAVAAHERQAKGGQDLLGQVRL